MGFNLGVPKLKKEFVKFNDAVNRGDWNAAADESHRTINKEVTKGIKIPTFSCAIIGSGINLLLPSIKMGARIFKLINNNAFNVFYEVRL
jgi:hypothetical protein